MSDISIVSSFDVSAVRAQSATRKQYQHFDDVIRAAQSLFAQDIWVNAVTISKELRVSQTSVSVWVREGLLVGNVIASYQKMQRELGMKAPTCKRNTKH